jgi:hypothetical protein
MSKILINNVTFLRKANTYGVPKGKQVKPKSSNSQLGLERKGHKYIKRENAGDGTYRYIYDEAKGNKAPSDKDMLQMVEDFQNAVSQDKKYRRYSKHFDSSDYNGAAKAMLDRGEEVLPESIISELDLMTTNLGTKVSEYLPAAVAAKEYKKMFNMALNRTTEYNQKIQASTGEQNAT